MPREASNAGPGPARRSALPRARYWTTCRSPWTRSIRSARVRVRCSADRSASAASLRGRRQRRPGDCAGRARRQAFRLRRRADRSSTILSRGHGSWGAAPLSAIRRSLSAPNGAPLTGLHVLLHAPRPRPSIERVTGWPPPTPRSAPGLRVDGGRSGWAMRGEPFARAAQDPRASQASVASAAPTAPSDGTSRSQGDEVDCERPGDLNHEGTNVSEAEQRRSDHTTCRDYGKTETEECERSSAVAYSGPKTRGNAHGPAAAAATETSTASAIVHASARRAAAMRLPSSASADSRGSSAVVIAFGSISSPNATLAATVKTPSRWRRQRPRGRACPTGSRRPWRAREGRSGPHGGEPRGD